MKTQLTILFIGMILLGCSSIRAPETTQAPSQTIPPKPTSTMLPVQHTVPSPTDIQLPYNPSVTNDQNCKPPYAVLPVSDGNDISEEEIVYELVRRWLRQYRQPDTSPFCRIEDYRIEKVYDDPRVYTSALEPRGDFMRVVVFSVKLIQVPSDWMSFAGELDPENWLHTSHVVAVTKTGEGYTLEFANP